MTSPINGFEYILGRMQHLSRYSTASDSTGDVFTHREAGNTGHTQVISWTCLSVAAASFLTFTAL